MRPAWEKNWVCDATITFSLTTQDSARRMLLYVLKNYMVSLAGWVVVASKNSFDYEYEGVTGGGSYGGGSTGPYDVWTSSGSAIKDIGWIILKSPTTPAGTFYIMLWYAGGTTAYYLSDHYAASDQMFQEPVGSAFPLPQPGAHLAYLRRARCFNAGGNVTYYSYFSGCPDDGSFFLVTRRSDQSLVHAGMHMFSVLDPASCSPGVMPVVIGAHAWDDDGRAFVGDLYSRSGTILSNWDDWQVQTPRTWFYPYCHGNICAPVRRVATMVGDDLAGMFPDFEGRALLFPAHLFRSARVGESSGSVGGGQPSRAAYLGRVPDFYRATTASILYARGDVLTDDEGNIRFYYVGINPSAFDNNNLRNRFWVPGDVAPP